MLCSVVVEVRQHLCCANVFLNFIHPVADSESFKINIEKELIRLKDSTGVVVAELNVGKYFTILTETFSNLIVDEENVSFRISVLNIQGIESGEPKSPGNTKFLLEEHQEASLHCKQCDSALCATRKYEKIREFPSGAIDVSEFFCHHGPSFSDVLLPRIQDIFYGFQFIVVNNANVESCTKQKDGHVYCKRCQRYLGESMLEGKAVKIWSESLAMKKHNDLELFDVFGGDEKYMPELLMLKVIKETSLPSPEPLLRNMHFTKVLLETTLPSRERQYLLVHILEKHLPVLKTARDKADDSAAYAVNVDLEMHFAFKILYRVIEPLRLCGVVNDADDDADASVLNTPAILSYWQQDINILKMNISSFLFGQLLDDLNCNSMILPEVYRNNKDQFTLSYIFQ